MDLLQAVLAVAVLSVIYRLLLGPPPHLLAATSNEHEQAPTAIPSALLPLSPSLAWTWWRLAWQQGVPPWRLHLHVPKPSQVDWHDEGAEGKMPIRQGQVVEAWQRVLTWNERNGCLPLKALRKWESLADPLADEALIALKKKRGAKEGTLTEGLVAGASDDEDADAETIARHRSHVTRRPPRGAGVIPLSWYAARDKRRKRPPPQWLREELSRSYEDLIPDVECTLADDAKGRHNVALARVNKLQQWQDEEWASLTVKEQNEELQEERRLISLGQDFFYRYSGGITLSLLHFSLAGGFASPRLTGILKKTGYLVPPDVIKSKSQDSEKAKNQGDRTWKRLMETTQWVLDVMERRDALYTPSECEKQDIDEDELSWPFGGSPSVSLGGQGRQSSIQVRFLHSGVRNRLLSKGVDFGASSSQVIPLNQTDLLSTLLSFSAAPLASLSRMGLDTWITQQEKEAFLGIWRYAGWLMGVDDRLVRRCLSTPHHADCALWSCVLNLFSEEDLRSSAINPPTYKILQSIADRPPFHRSFQLHAAFTTSLVGTQLSDALGLPRPSFRSKAQVYITYAGMFITIAFGQFWRQTWDKKRILASKKLLRRLVVWNLGNKRSLFVGEGVADGMVEFDRDQEAAMRDVRLYQVMIREMVGVCGFVAVAVLGGCAAFWYRG